MDGSYIRKANQYIRQVLDGTIPACKWVKLACQRQKDDLVKAKGKAWPYKFDKEAAERVCAFVELMPHVKGEWANRRERISLEPWQCFILTTTFGWVSKKTGYRRFRTCYTEVPRKNAKSALSSGVALYMLGADGEEGAEVYSAATTKEQAKIVFDTAAAMVGREAGLREEMGIGTTKYSVFQASTNSSFRPLVRDQSGNLDGLNVHCAIIDELHGHKERGTWDVIVTGTGARSQPMVWAITTAGFNRNGICYEQRTYLTQVLQGSAVDESFFGIIYTIDDGDDWKDPSSWQKANPNWGVSVNPEQVEQLGRKAKTMASAQHNFLTKHLNVWVNSDRAWMNMAEWEKCSDAYLTIEDMQGLNCIIGADLASKTDFASVAKVFRKKIDNDWHYYAFLDHYLNERAAEENPTQGLPGWIEDGWVKVTEGNVTDFNLIEEDIVQSFRDIDGLTEAAFDPHQASQMQQNLALKNVTCVEYTMTLKNLSEPTKELEKLVLAGHFHHNGDPVLTWMVSNVVAHMDAKETIFPKKDKTMPYAKIDGAIAVIIAIGRFMQAKEPEKKFQAFVFGGRR